jgi:hypothetical protein
MKTRDDYERFLADVRKTTGIEALVPDETGLVSVRVQDEFNVNLQFVEATGKILCFIEVAELPKDAGRGVYRELLAAGLFGKETAGGYFALEPNTEIVVYNYYFDLETAELDVDDFVSTLEKILQLCDLWSGRLKDILAENNNMDSFFSESHIQIHP